ncbi:cache domain-containing sensor histidine kinase [Paenibacillus sp.]|uniref:cache domain-containing sensor histidine kinase n=1 Tax=Paenibacillus sp. TaxID=58172 RepID=UPI002D59E027|nr:histidine kinase [Paenibacillus sp.]HZG85781.1 histidine kinase [Paenibacillus sp.]
MRALHQLKVRIGSFRTKLLLTSIACLLIPTLITLSVSNILTRDAVKEQAETNAAEQLKLIDGYLSNLLANMLYISNYIIVEPDMNVILKEQAAGKTYAGPDAEYREFEDRNEIIKQINNIAIVGEKTYVTILLPNGRYFTNYSVEVEDFDPLRLVEEPWFRELEKLTGMEAYWVEAEPSPYLYEEAAGRYQISVARTLRRPNFEIYAYVIVTVTDNQILDIFRRLAVNQEVMLVDGEGRIMSHLDRGRIGERLPYIRPGEDGSAIVQLDGEDYLVAQRRLAVKDWKLVLLTPYKDAVHKINHIFQSVFLFQIVAFATFLVVLILLIRAFTKPIVRLGKLAHTVQRGNLEVRSQIRGSDEIGRLASSFDQMLDRIKQMIAEVTAEQSRKRKAELAMLQAQINPHFLFNVLNSIRMKVLRKGDEDSAEMISSLSRLLRMTIGREEEAITLHEEVSTAIDYVNLMNMRQKEKVRLDADVSSDAMLARVPRFILQPIIENALIHGLRQSNGTIAVVARRTERGELEIVVRDDGEGMDAEALARLRTRLEAERHEPGEPSDGRGSRFSGIGLPNVCERMRIRYGGAFRMTVESELGAGTAITMRFPLQQEA